MTGIDQVQLKFDPGSLMVLNVILGLIMFGIALDLKVEDFKRVARSPRGVVVGLVAQLVLLPAMTWALSRVLAPTPSIALGMIMVAACPGGNISNFFTYAARGDASLSISITSVCTVLAVFTTPLNMSLWGSLSPDTAAVLHEISLDLPELVLTLFLLLGLPLGLGMVISRKFPKFAARAQKPFKIGALVVFVAFVLIALGNNFDHFLDHIGTVFGLVLVHNSAAFTLGYLVARLAKLPESQRRALTIEVGIQNSGLGLILIFGFFGGLGGMAIIAAWWGIWHMIAGLSLVGLWARKPPEDHPAPQPAAA